MNTTEASTDGSCAVCRKSQDGEKEFVHLYHEGRRFSVCCPICMRLFQRAPDRFASGERCATLLDELLDELKWKNGKS